jgi:hypothetical protein
MSSEESDWEDGVRSADTLRTRGYAWRSSRLLNFYNELDVEEMSDKSTKPKRGVGKRLRVPGPVHESLLPPKGVATWMISRRWFKVTQATHPDLADRLQALVINESGQWDSTRLQVLGEESDSDKSLASPEASPIEQPMVGYTFPPAEQQDLKAYPSPTQPPVMPPMPNQALCPSFEFPSSSLGHALFQ